MNTHSVEHRISALVLVIAVSVIGVALPASASGKGKIVVPRHQALTINGRPLAQLLSTTTTARDAFLLAGLLEQGVWDGTVLSSFEALQPVLKVGQQVRVSDEIVDSGWKGFAIGTAAGAAVLGLAGNSYAAMPGAMLGGIVGYLVDRSTHSWMSVTGKVVSISSDQLVIARPRAFFRSEEWAFTEDVVRSIHIVDSDLNGILLGMAPGMALMFLSCGQSDAGNLCGLVPMMVTGLGMMVGGAIDFFMTQPVYERRPHGSRVTVSPLLGRGQKGVVAHVRF